MPPSSCRRRAAMAERVTRLVTRGGMTVAALLLAVAGARAQAPPSTDPTIQALLTEVRGLRAAMEQMASAGPRIQLFTARLQLQESRANNMIRRLDDVRDRLSGAREELATAEQSQKAIEERLASPNLPSNDQERQALTEQLPAEKRHAAT